MHDNRPAPTVPLLLGVALIPRQDAHTAVPLNARQRKAVNALLDEGPGGFEGGMSTRKYVSLAGTSRRNTASRELIELDALGVLKQCGAG